MRFTDVGSTRKGRVRCRDRSALAARLQRHEAHCQEPLVIDHSTPFRQPVDVLVRVRCAYRQHHDAFGGKLLEKRVRRLCGSSRHQNAFRWSPLQANPRTRHPTSLACCRGHNGPSTKPARDAGLDADCANLTAEMRQLDGFKSAAPQPRRSPIAASTVTTASPIQASTKVASLASESGSPKAQIAIRKCPVGTMYCRRPRVTSGSR